MIPNYCKHIVRYYNLVSGNNAESIKEIPFNSLRAILAQSHRERCSVLISLDIPKLEQGRVSQDGLAIRYETTRGAVRYVKDKFSR